MPRSRGHGASAIVRALLPVSISGLTLAFTACTTPTPLAPACRPWQGGNSTEPPSHCFFFPGNAAIDPLGDILYVTNTNADLSFGGATVVAVDLLRHERAVECFRRHERRTESDPECGSISCADSGWALGRTATLEETERREAMSGQPVADFDRCYCEFDLDDPNVVNCEPQRFILSDQTVKVGFFPGNMKLLVDDPPDWKTALANGSSLHRGLYLAVRGDPSITFIDATRPILPGRSFQPADLAKKLVNLDCGADNSATASAPHVPGEPYVLKQCGDISRVQQTPEGDVVPVDPNDPSAGTQPRFTVPPEPMGVYIDRGCIKSGYHLKRGTNQCYPNSGMGPPEPCYPVDASNRPLPDNCYQYLVASHLGTGQVSAYALGKYGEAPVPPRLQDVSVPLLPADNSGLAGGFSVTPRIAGDLSQPWYLTSRVSGNIATFRLASAAGPRSVPGLAVDITGQFSQLTSKDVRDLVFTPDGNRAFAAVFTPPALLALDTTVRGGSGAPVNQVENIVNLCLGPARIVLAEVPRYTMGTPVRMTRLYVTCYTSGQVAEIDGDSGELLSTTLVGRGPLSIALNFGQHNGDTAIDPCVDPYVSDGEAATRGVNCLAGPKDLRQRPPRPASAQAGSSLGPRAYVSAYLDNVVAVVDLDPRSPNYRRMVSRIGLPTPKQVQ